VEIKIKWIKRKQMTNENTYRDDIPRTLLNKDLLIFVPEPGLQLLLVFIMNSAKNVIKNIFSTKKVIFYNTLYISTKYIQVSGKKLHK
jgi:hypothetical protein